MKIAYVITRSDSIGGAHIHVADLATEMQKRGLTVHVFVGGNGPFCNFLASKQIACTSVPSLVREIAPVQDIRAYFQLKRLLSSFGPDLVHAHSSKAGVLGRLASRSLKLPCVFTAHGWAFTEGVSARKQTFYRYIERALAPLANTIITVSEYDRNLALANKVGRPSQLVTVINGVPDTALPKAPARPTTQADAPVRLIMVARFDEPKDQATLVQALSVLNTAQAPAATQNWQLELVGDGPLIAAVMQQAKDAGLEQKIHFAGSRNDVPARLAEADIFVLSSRWEGLPLSILEATAAGLPVVATNVGGVPETVIDGETGYLVKRSDAQALAAKLKALIQDPALRSRLGAQARKLYEQKFGLPRMVSETQEVYKRALQRH